MTSLLKQINDYMETQKNEMMSITNMVDYMNNLFFNYNDDSRQIVNMTNKALNKLPFNGLKNEIVHYGGDYVITNSLKDDDKDYIMHFVLPGHNHKTVDVAKRDRHIIIKSKELNKDDADYSSTSYHFYKSIPLIKKSFEVQSVVFKDGILSIAIKDMEETPKEELLEITQG